MRLNRAALWALLVFSLVLGVGALLAGELLGVRKQESRQTVAQIADSAAHSLVLQLSRSLSATSALAAILRQEGGIDDFDALAAEMIRVYGGIDAIQLVPDGVITQVYPLVGNEKAVGFDILRDPVRSFEALRALESRRLSLEGPFELRQGGMAVVGRQAVFLPHGRDGERFWGFTAVVIRMSTLVGASNLALLEKNGFAYQVYRVHAGTGARIVFARGGGESLSDPVELSFSVPNGRWGLAVAPSTGWLKTSEMLLYGTAVFAVSLALAGFTYLILRRPELLRREVEKRTVELGAVRKRLEEEVRERARAEEEVRRLNADLEQLVVERTSQLADANQELASFSYSVSHDLRAPLCTIEGFTRILREEYAGSLDDDGRQLLMRICRAGSRMKDLIDHLLELSRAGRGELVRQRVDLSAMVREIAAELQGGDPGRNVSFRIADGVMVSGDAGLLRLALDNLLSNAWKYSRGTDGALIEFGEESQGGVRVFFVRDNGVGFDMEHADQIFSLFQRLHSADEFEGTGIGLATVKRIVLRHGGRIWAEGAAGSGATFFFTLGED